MERGRCGGGVGKPRAPLLDTHGKRRLCQYSVGWRHERQRRVPHFAADKMWPARRSAETVVWGLANCSATAAAGGLVLRTASLLMREWLPDSATRSHYLGRGNSLFRENFLLRFISFRAVFLQLCLLTERNDENIIKYFDLLLSLSFLFLFSQNECSLISIRLSFLQEPGSEMKTSMGDHARSPLFILFPIYQFCSGQRARATIDLRIQVPLDTQLLTMRTVVLRRRAAGAAEQLAIRHIHTL